MIPTLCMKVLIVAKQNDLGIKMAMRAEKKIKEITEDVNFDMSTALKLRKRGVSIRKFDGDLIVTIGGDGTFLHTSSRTTIPILPVKIEGHGFLCTTTMKELIENIKRLENKDYIISERMRIQCLTKGTPGRLDRYLDRLLKKNYPYSMNEIVFARKRPSKILSLEYEIDGVKFEVAGDGLLFSTPSGSTAYSASAGGSLIDPSLKVIKVVPLYPFFSKLKPMVLPSSKEITVNVKKGECAMIIDGHGGDYVKAGNEFVIKEAEPQKVISFQKANFYQKFKDEFLH